MCHPGCCGVWQVDAEALGIPGYRRVVKHPMDLGTIHARLAPGGVLWQPASCLAPKDQQQALHVAAALGSRSRCPCTNLANPVSPLCLLKFSPALHACLRLPGCLQAQPRGGAWLPTRAPLRWRRTCSWCLQNAGATTQEPAASGEAGRQAGWQAGRLSCCCHVLPCPALPPLLLLLVAHGRVRGSHKCMPRSVSPLLQEPSIHCVPHSLRCAAKCAGGLRLHSSSCGTRPAWGPSQHQLLPRRGAGSVSSMGRRGSAAAAPPGSRAWSS